MYLSVSSFLLSTHVTWHFPCTIADRVARSRLSSPPLWDVLISAPSGFENNDIANKGHIYITTVPTVFFMLFSSFILYMLAQLSSSGILCRLVSEIAHSSSVRCVCIYVCLWITHPVTPWRYKHTTVRLFISCLFYGGFLLSRESLPYECVCFLIALTRLCYCGL